MGMLTIFGIFAVAVILNVTRPLSESLLLAREETWLLTLAAFAAMLVVAGRTVGSRWDGIFIDRDNRISLSRFQLILWVVLIVSAVLTAAMGNLVLHEVEPLDLKIPAEIWGLLGLGAFTAVAAPAIKEGQKNVPFRNAATTNSVSATAKMIKNEQKLGADGQFVRRVYVKDMPEDARWIDMIKGDYEGAAYVDVSKLQQLVFTIVLVVVYGFAIWAQMAVPKRFPGFPIPDRSFLALLAVSHAAYLADKQISNT